MFVLSGSAARGPPASARTRGSPWWTTDDSFLASRISAPNRLSRLSRERLERRPRGTSSPNRPSHTSRQVLAAAASTWRFTMLYLRHPSSLEHDPTVLSPEHPDTPERIGAIEAAMAASGWLGCDVREAPAATEPELELVHTRSQVRTVHDLCAIGGGQIDADTYVGEASYRAALHAAGGACALVRAIVRGEDRAGFSALRPSGHHAGPDYAMGFCLFNNIAIAAELAIRELGVDRVLIVDWDVHHGNGTAHIFRHRSDVLFASIHQLGLFPGTGSAGDVGSGQGLGYTINAPVPHGA